jgi:hypothetical protein
MTLKHKKSHAPVAPSGGGSDKWTGPWGRINPVSDSFDVVRFCQNAAGGREKTHSYPYRVITSWHWTDAAPEEELKIEASADLITVRGRGLDQIVDALDRGMLEILREIPGITPAPEDGMIWISTITVANAR